MAGPEPDRPLVIAPPPILYLGAMGIGWGLHMAFPVPLLPQGVARLIGIAACLLGAALGATGFRGLRRAGTNVNPRRPTTALVASGAYRISRNPLYLSLLCVYIGIACFVNDLWPFMLAVPLVAVLRVGVIAPEERYLERKFGEDYRRYCARVRRWI